MTLQSHQNRMLLNRSLTWNQWRFVSKKDERKDAKEKEAFQKDIKYFLSKDQFTFFDFHDRVLISLKDKGMIKSMLLGEDEEIKVLEIQNKICSAMFQQEKSDISILSE